MYSDRTIACTKALRSITYAAPSSLLDETLVEGRTDISAATIAYAVGLTNLSQQMSV